MVTIGPPGAKEIPAGPMRAMEVYVNPRAKTLNIGTSPLTVDVSSTPAMVVLHNTSDFYVYYSYDEKNWVPIEPRASRVLERVILPRVHLRADSDVQVVLETWDLIVGISAPMAEVYVPWSRIGGEAP